MPHIHLSKLIRKRAHLSGRVDGVGRLLGSVDILWLFCIVCGLAASRSLLLLKLVFRSKTGSKKLSRLRWGSTRTSRILRGSST